MNALEIISQDLFDKVRSRFSNLQMGGENGAVTVVPQEARFFDFDFVVEGANLGRVSISINDLGSLKVYYSQGIVEDTESTTQKFWFDFLREMRQFAKRRMLRFDTRDISKGNLDKNDFAYLATQQAAQQASAQSTVPQESNMTTESTMYGSSKSSYRPLEKTLLIIRHNVKVGEDRGARSRPNNIKAVFIQNEAGERFKYPYAHLAGAKAMQRHVSNGGTPFDPAGSSIMQMSEQIKQLSTFKRQVGNVDSLTNEARGIVDRVGSKLSTLRATIEHIAKQSHYEAWRESLDEAIAEMSEIDAATIEDYKNTFTVSSYKEDLTQYFPLLYKVMQETSTVDLEDYVGEDKEDVCSDCEKDPCECDDEVKESFDAFEEWADEIAEGPKPSDVPAYLRKQQGKAPLTTKDLEDEESDGKISHPKTLAKNSGRDVKEGGYYLGAEDLPDWTRDALHRVAKGEVRDWPELYGELSNFIDDEKKAELIAKRVWQKGGGEDTMAKHRVQADPVMDIPKDDSEDDDNSFLNRLRQQARGGSIKPGVDTGGVEMEEMDDSEHADVPMKEIAQKVLSHIDRETGGCPLGATAVGIQVGKEYGDRAGELAEKLVHHLQAKFEANKQMESIRRLSGLPKIAEDHAPWYKDQTEADADKKKSEFKKKNNPNRTGKDTAKALSQKGLDKASKQHG
jgi:hypothetical protein